MMLAVTPPGGTDAYCSKEPGAGARVVAVQLFGHPYGRVESQLLMKTSRPCVASNEDSANTRDSVRELRLSRNTGEPPIRVVSVVGTPSARRVSARVVEAVTTKRALPVPIAVMDTKYLPGRQATAGLQGDVAGGAEHGAAAVRANEEGVVTGELSIGKIKLEK